MPLQLTRLARSLSDAWRGPTPLERATRAAAVAGLAFLSEQTHVRRLAGADGTPVRVVVAVGSRALWLDELLAQMKAEVLAERDRAERHAATMDRWPLARTREYEEGEG